MFLKPIQMKQVAWRTHIRATAWKKMESGKKTKKFNLVLVLSILYSLKNVIDARFYNNQNVWNYGQQFILYIHGHKLQEEATISYQLWAPGITKAWNMLYSNTNSVQRPLAGLFLLEGLIDLLHQLVAKHNLGVPFPQWLIIFLILDHK